MARHSSARWFAATIIGIAAILAGCGTGADVSSTTQVSSDAPTTTDSSTTSTTLSPTTTTDSSTSTTTTTTAEPGEQRPSAPTAPAPSPAPVGHWRLEGRQQVVETIALNTGRCPMLDQHVQGHFTETDGAVWDFSAEVCASIDASSVWSGGGPVLLTSSRGDLRGSYFNFAQLPTDGVPYVIDIRSGTGEFTGAHGRCVIQENIQKVTLLLQNKRGEFVCDLDAPPSGEGAGQ